MTGRFTAMSGFLTGLFSQSPNRAPSSSNTDNKENQGVMDEGGMDSNAVAGPSRLPASPGQKGALPILQDKTTNDDSLMYGVELDISMLDDPPPPPTTASGGRSITSSGFYGTATAGGSRTKRSRGKTIDKGKGKAREDEPRSKAPRRVMEDSFQPVRVYRCPPADQPLYTIDRAKRTITIHATDADSSYWPSKAHQRSTSSRVNNATTSYGVELDQQPSSSPSKKKDWHEPVNSETKQCLIWKQKCGAGLAGLLALEDPKSWKLADWPDGYKMFIKHQYQNQYSFFHYIIGSSFLCTKRFKTAKEYTNHLYWLCTFGDNIHARCKCKFCVREYEKDGKPRTAIIQRCIRVKPNKDAPPPAKKIRIAEAPSVSKSSKPIVEVPVPASSTATPNQSRSKRDEVTEPPTGPPSLVSSALPLVSAAGGLLSKVFGYSASAPTISATISGPPLKPTVATQKKGRKGGRPPGSTAAAMLARRNPVVEIVSPSHPGSKATVLETATVSSAMISETSVLGKRKRTEKNYYIQSIAEVEAAEAAAMEANLSANGSVNGNGRAVRSTRNSKSMKESPPPPLRGPSGPMYTGPFIHRKRHDDLKVHSAPYREHELVWYKLGKAHVCPSNPKVQITHWPAEISSRTLKIETHHVEMVSIEDMNGDRMDIPQPVNAQYYVYTISLMGLEGDSSTTECRVEDLLPWVTFYTPEVMRGPEASVLLRKMDRPLKSLSHNKEDFHRVLTTWAWARHWADAVRAHLSPFGLFFDNETLKKMRRRKTGGFFNGTSKKKRTRAERDAREKEMIRELEMIANNVQQYQGVWFGSEKIWVGDMVRLAGTFEKPANSDVPSTPQKQEALETAYLQLYKGRSTRDGHGPMVRLQGFKKTDTQSLGKPAFLQITHIYRVPGHNEGPGSLQFDGVFYELLKESVNKARNPPSLYGDMQGVFDTSDTSSSSTTEQNAVIEANGEKRPDVGMPGLYRKELLPPAPAGFAFKPLKRLSGINAEDGPSGLLPYMLAGRYYPPDVLFPDVIDPQTRKLVRAVSGKTYRPDTLMKAIQWQANRRLMLQSSRKQATKDMDKYFKKREEKERKAELRDQLIREAKEARENGANLSDEDDAPMVATSKSTAPISRNRAGQERLQSSNKQTTVTSGDDDDSDAIVVATTKI